ncbi:MULTISPECIES: hypothetical protein [unclassified Psychrobacter]|uniref:hypothetical protein n=1 Tax=unclassified Psychrobacter TaxID=196806 RepID=UPI003F465294
MEPISFASFTLAAVLASLPGNSEPVSQSVITTHISPAIAGQWEIDLDSGITMTKEAIAKQMVTGSAHDIETNEPEITVKADGVLNQSERRVFKVIPNIAPSTITDDNIKTKSATQCRELYNFGADNEMWAVSGKEWTYGRYLVTHREEGLPIIAIKTIYDNNEVDCSGNQIDQTDEALIAYLNHDGNEMQWCADPEGKQCFMNFHRVLP